MSKKNGRYMGADSLSVHWESNRKRNAIGTEHKSCLLIESLILSASGIKLHQPAKLTSALGNYLVYLRFSLSLELKKPERRSRSLNHRFQTITLLSMMKNNRCMMLDDDRNNDTVHILGIMKP